MIAGQIFGKIMLPQSGQESMRSLPSWRVGLPQRPQKRLSRYHTYRCQAVISAYTVYFGWSLRWERTLS